MNLGSAAMLAHFGIPGPTPFVAMGLFFAGIGAAAGALWFLGHRGNAVRRATGFGLGVVTLGCLGVGTAFPFIIHAGPVFGRPSTTARLQMLSPRSGEVLHGDPAIVPVVLRLSGGRVVPLTSIHLVPNEGHIHLYLDGSLEAMTGLDASIAVQPGSHTLEAEFVAVDHGPFRPPVIVTVAFRVLP